MRNRILVLAAAALLLTGGVAASAIGKAKPKTTTTKTTTKTTTTKKHATKRKRRQTTFTATLGTKQEFPLETGAPAAARGTFTATLNGYMLTWKLTYAHLSGKATAAHIHLGGKGKVGGAIVSICGPCTTPSKGHQKVTPTIVKNLRAGTTYVNVHTRRNPNGEIRGQIG